MKKPIVLLVLFISSITIYAQVKTRAQLSGKVTDSKTGEPLAGASILLSESRNGTTSDSKGQYSLQNIPSGHALIEVSYLGYKSIVEHLDISGSDVHDFALTPSIRENEGVIVTGVAGATSIRKASVPITRISRSELISVPATNIIDAISRQPGVSQVSTGPAISKPVIRGLGYNRLVVVNDGVRQEGQQWGDEHGIEIDENSVSRIEILKGPASLIYGSDAMAGVVNIITTNPLPNNTVSGSILTSYQTNNRQRSVYANLGGNVNGFNWNAWGDYKAAADYSNKYDGRVYNSKFNERNAGAYIGYNGHWGFSHLVVSNFNQRLGVIEGDRDSTGRFTRLMPGGMETNPTATDFNSTDPQVPWQHVRHFKIIADNRFKLGRGNLSLNLGWQQNRRQEFGNAEDAGTASLSFNLNTFNYKMAYHLNDLNGWNSSFGISGMRQENHIGGEELLIPAYELFDAGGFAYTQKTVGLVTLSGGIRYDNRHINSFQLMEGTELKFAGQRKNFGNFSGSAGLSYAAGDHVQIKFNFAKGFRAPSIPELASNGAHEGTNRYEYGNPDMKSESSWQTDAGFEYNAEHLFFSATAFYNSINHFIFYTRLSSLNGGDSLVEADGGFIPAYQFNQRKAALYGIEMQMDIHPHPFDWLHWENSFSYVRGKFSEPLQGVDHLPLIPPARWISELKGDLLRKGKTFRNLSMHMDVDHTFAQDNAFTAFDTETPTASYTLLNAGLSSSVMLKEKTLFTLHLLATNISDVAYQSHLSRLKYTAENQVTGRTGVFNMGRSYSIKLNIPLDFKRE